jgi:hypothetical protein
LETFDSRVAIQNDVCSSFLLDIFVIVDDDTKNPIPPPSAIKEMDAYHQQHREANLSDAGVSLYLPYASASRFLSGRVARRW